jgi:hypothetical protein
MEEAAEAYDRLIYAPNENLAIVLRYSEGDDQSS